MIRAAASRGLAFQIGRGSVFLALLAVSGIACGGGGIPDPKEAALAYADAARRGDAHAIYDMMSDKSRRALRPPSDPAPGRPLASAFATETPNG